jgi:SAM-dependent methyltransferase
MADRNGEMQAYYALGKERDRLASGVGRVEFARTIDVVGRTMPAPPATVADIGGGPGRYTDWLVERGYTVVHRDLVADHVHQVTSRHGAAVDTLVGDARALDLPDGSVDVVLLLGPLYHLLDRADRLQALCEARRITRHGGMVHAAAISRWAPRLHGMLVDRVHHTYPALAHVIDDMEATGRMPPITQGGFTGYAHTPGELRDEITEAGLALESLVPLEGITVALPDLDQRMDDPVEQALLLGTLRAVEHVADIVGIGPHLLATARNG